MTTSVQDLNRQYGSTYAMYDGKPLYIESIDERRNIVGNIYIKDNGWVGTNVPWEGDDKLITKFPLVGMLELPCGAVYAERVAERQWKRGFRKNHMQFYDISMQERGTRLWSVVSNPELVQEAFCPTNTPAGIAFTSIMDGAKLSHRLSATMAMAAITGVALPSLVYKKHIVGKVDMVRGVPTAILYGGVSHLNEEVSDIMTIRSVA